MNHEPHLVVGNIFGWSNQLHPEVRKCESQLGSTMPVHWISGYFASPQWPERRQYTTDAV
jgi:hypothetical protein